MEGSAHPSSTQHTQDEATNYYKSDEFRLYCFKIIPCSKRFSHDWSQCPYAHPTERAKRRDLRVYKYDCIMCPAVEQGEECPLGLNCPHSHNAFESWLHPQKYRTLICKDRENCNRPVCFFAHGTHDLRMPCEPDPPPALPAGIPQPGGAAGPYTAPPRAVLTPGGSYGYGLGAPDTAGYSGSSNLPQQQIQTVPAGGVVAGPAGCQILHAPAMLVGPQHAGGQPIGRLVAVDGMQQLQWVQGQGLQQHQQVKVPGQPYGEQQQGAFTNPYQPGLTVIQQPLGAGHVGQLQPVLQQQAGPGAALQSQQLHLQHRQPMQQQPMLFLQQQATARQSLLHMQQAQLQQAVQLPGSFERAGSSQLGSGDNAWVGGGMVMQQQDLQAFTSSSSSLAVPGHSPQGGALGAAARSDSFSGPVASSWLQGDAGVTWQAAAGPGGAACTPTGQGQSVGAAGTAVASVRQQPPAPWGSLGASHVLQQQQLLQRQQLQRQQQLLDAALQQRQQGQGQQGQGQQGQGLVAPGSLPQQEQYSGLLPQLQQLAITSSSLSSFEQPLVPGMQPGLLALGPLQHQPQQQQAGGASGYILAQQQQLQGQAQGTLESYAPYSAGPTGFIQ